MNKQNSRKQERLSSKEVASPPSRIRVVSSGGQKSTSRSERNRRASFKKADITRAMSALAKAGFKAASVEVTPEGSIRINAAGVEPEVSLFEQWSDRL